MSAELNRCYELLGVKPGASVAELKAAYRDMAKVWHPDRFGHDERLQKKAQDKLKEINEAYEQLISGKVPRPRPSATSKDNASAAEQSAANARKQMKWQWAVVPLMIFVAVFFALSQLRKSDAPAAESVETQKETTRSEASSNQVPTETRNRKVEASSTRDSKGEEQAQTQPAAAPVQAMATVTVLIDPSTGLLAKSDCPTKSRMTYPAGSEPHGYCTAAHAAHPQADDSKVKSIAKRVVTPTKWIGSSKEKSEGDRQ